MEITFRSNVLEQAIKNTGSIDIQPVYNNAQTRDEIILSKTKKTITRIGIIYVLMGVLYFAIKKAIKK